MKIIGNISLKGHSTKHLTSYQKQANVKNCFSQEEPKEI